MERAETNPNIHFATDGQEINDVRDKPITAPEIKHGRDAEFPAPHVLDLHPERKRIIIVQESCEKGSFSLATQQITIIKHTNASILYEELQHLQASDIANVSIGTFTKQPNETNRDDLVSAVTIVIQWIRE